MILGRSYKNRIKVTHVETMVQAFLIDKNYKLYMYCTEKFFASLGKLEKKNLHLHLILDNIIGIMARANINKVFSSMFFFRKE